MGGTDSRDSRVFVFVREAGVWNFRDYLEASNAEADDKFGSSLAVSGRTIVVGASGEDSSGSGGQGDNSVIDSGAVYVFE